MGRGEEGEGIELLKRPFARRVLEGGMFVQGASAQAIPDLQASQEKKIQLITSSANFLLIYSIQASPSSLYPLGIIYPQRPSVRGRFISRAVPSTVFHPYAKKREI